VSDRPAPSRLLFPAALVLGGALLGVGGSIAWQATGGRGATERVIHEYLLAHPEVLPEAVDKLQSKQMLARIDPLRGALETAYPGAVLGNPNGRVTLVEFTDYACPYCRASMADVKDVIAANRDLKVIVREEPVLSAGSVEAARMALAAADQGRYPAFHDAMFAKDGPSAAAIETAAREAGLDLARARADIAAGKYDAELTNNTRMGQSIGFTGTPSWVIGEQAFSGAVGKELLTDAIAKARQASESDG
jgi:protein-disulfide isomerase